MPIKLISAHLNISGLDAWEPISAVKTGKCATKLKPNLVLPEVQGWNGNILPLFCVHRCKKGRKKGKSLREWPTVE